MTLAAVLSPIFLWGAALLAVPLIIHLLNRRRFRTVTWAAMDFVLQAYKKKHRRMRVENLLLLLVRCAIPVLLALAMARPFFGPNNPLSLVAESRREVVIVLDVSYSMDRELEAGTAYQAALGQVRRLFDLLDPDSGDTCMLVTLAEKPRVVLGRSAVRAEWESALERLREPTHGIADLARTMELLETEVLPQIPSEAEVFLFTDLQRNTFEPALIDAAAIGAPAENSAAPEAAANFSVKARLERMSRAGTSLQIVNVVDGRAPAENCIALDLRAAEPVAIVGQNLRLTATVWRPAGPAPAQSVGGTFELGKTQRSVSLEFDREGKATVEIYHTFTDVGDQAVEFRLDGDDLARDDARFLRVPVRAGIPVLIVDGDPQGADETEGAAGTLLTVLDPQYDPYLDPVASGASDRYFLPKWKAHHDFNLGRERLDEYDAVFFVNVPELEGERVVPALESYVRQGGGVCFFLGDRVHVASYNERLYRPDGSGLMPQPLRSTLVGEPNALGQRTALARFSRMQIADELHPAVRTFVDEALRVYLASPVFCYLPFDSSAPTPAGLRTPLRFAGREGAESGDAALVDHSLGRGNVLWFMSSVGPEWSLLAETANAYFPLYWDIAHYLSRSDPATHQLRIGESIRKTVPIAPTGYTITKPGGEVRSMQEVAAEPVDGRFPLPPFDETDVPGAYVLELPTDTGVSSREVYAVNVDPEEGDLATLDRDQLAQMLDAELFDYLVEVSGDASESAIERQGEIWKTLIAVLLALLLLETLMAWRFGAYG